MSSLGLEPGGST